MTSVSSLTRSSPGVNRRRRFASRSNTPRKCLPMPIGQETGAQSIFSTDSISSSSVDGLAHLAVHLVDEGDDRRRAQPADVEQLDRLRLDALGGVDDHDRGVDGGQHPVGVLREILVAGRVEQVDRVPGVVELHHRARHRDAALLLDLHPVRGRVPRALPRLHGAGEQDRAAEEQQLLGQRRLAGVRMGNDRERPSPSDFVNDLATRHHSTSPGLGTQFSRCPQRDAHQPLTRSGSKRAPCCVILTPAPLFYVLLKAH